jgi:cell wall-associated NlpC family hydrolase
MSEQEFREALCEEAITWLGTPYRSSGRLKGVGVNCAMFLYLVGKVANALPANAPEPGWYTPQFAQNNKEERLINYLEAYGAREIDRDSMLPGDVIAYKTGKSHGHVALCLGMPQIIHCTVPFGCELGMWEDGKLKQFGKKFFTFWRSDET